MNLIKVPNYGEVGAGVVVPFTPRPDKEDYILLPPGLKENDRIFTHSVSGDSLYDPYDRDRSLNHGDTLICKGVFHISEVTPKKICIVHILPTCELIAKKVAYQNGMVSLAPANPRYPVRKYPATEIEIKALVVGFQRNF